MKILGIETSCDETAVCLIEIKDSHLTVLSNQLYSQVAKHKEFGGVFPMLAKREHQKNLVPLLIKCLEESGISAIPALDKAGWHSDDGAVEHILEREEILKEEFVKNIVGLAKPNIDAIAVTNGPGLEPALWVGVNFAKALGALWSVPVIATNHMEGHIVIASLHKTEINSFLIKETKYPAIALLISGGHTELVLVKDNREYEVVGRTRDDAVGEAYDKVARMLGLPYPGGPEITKLAEEKKVGALSLPRPMIHSKDLDFSFSGLKTSVLYKIKELPEITEEIKKEICFEFQNAVIDVLVSKTQKALEQFNAKTLIVGGGVIANTEIRKALENLATETGVELQLPEIAASTDNALMIALAGYLKLQNTPNPDDSFKAVGNLTF